MDMSPALQVPLRTLKEVEAKNTYFVKAQYGKAREWLATEEHYSRKAVVEDLANNQLDQAIEVHVLRGRIFDDVSRIIAQEALAAYIELGELTFENIPAFCILHIPDADQQVADAMRDAEREQAHIDSERYAGAR